MQDKKEEEKNNKMSEEDSFCPGETLQIGTTWRSKKMCDVIEYTISLEEKSSRQKNKQLKHVSMARLSMVLAVTASLTTAELVIAQITHSITLLVLVHQNIYNSITVCVACASTKLSNEEESLKNTFGWHRIEVVGSICSLIFLLSLCFATFVESLQTLFHTGHLDTMHHPDWILLLCAVHLLVWTFSFVMVGGHTHLQNTAVRIVTQRRFLKSRGISKGEEKTFKDILSEVRLKEIARDLHGLIYNLVTCCMIKFEVLREEYTPYADPILGIIFISTLIYSSSSLFRDSCNILLQTIPGNVEIGLLKRVLLAKFPDVVGIHEIHVWTFTPGDLVLTAHLKYQNKQSYLTTFRDVDNFFKEHGFRKVTIQPEFVEDVLEDVDACTWSCQSSDCESKICCAHTASKDDHHSESRSLA